MRLPFNPATRIDISLLIVRLGLLVDFVVHGSQKLFGAFGGGGVSGTGAFLASIGANPGPLWAVVVGLVEFVGALCVGVGLFTRIAAAAIAIDMFTAIVMYNWPHGFFAETATGGWEINMLIIAMCLALAFAGAGAYSLDAPIARRRGSRSAAVVSD
ncbi:DoxX family protein [Leifsonia shinshuensis]|uniref:DoxX family protein n=1 Tax=Leifsonia shinshuensis TaxID=150026 RepID=A0A7G6YAA2_9MICO|nr:DoxX family protein [Leifsonia shinshuensis]QNE35417.1 DoxX family protein [Leifsonia shinshuensis]